MNSAVAAALAAIPFLCVPGLVMAQAPGTIPGARAGNGQQYNPNEGLQPNGCVKACPLDTNPCDPPEYKRADGRCSLKD